MKKDKIFYGWVIVAVFLIISATFLGIRFSFGVFFKSIQADFGLNRAATSSVYSAFTMLGAFFAVVSGWAVDKYGPRLVIFLMGVFAAVSMLLTSYTTSFWQLFLTYSLLASVGTAGTMPVLLAVVSRWFHRKRGTAIGIAGAGSGLGTLVAAPLSAYLIFDFGWRTALVVIALIVGTLSISLSTLLRRNPQEIGAFPDGIRPPVNTSEPLVKDKSRELAGLSVKHVLRMRNFWLVFFVWVLFSSALSMMVTHLVPYATDAGISAIEASVVMSVMSGVQVLARVMSGRICDAIGKKIPGVISVGICMGALLWLTQIQQLWMFYLFAVIYGLSWGGFGVVSLMLAVDSFAGPSLGLIMGMLEVGFAVGASVGSALGGIIFDATGGYTAAFLSGAAGMLIIAVLIVLARQEKVADGLQPGTRQTQ